MSALFELIGVILKFFGGMIVLVVAFFIDAIIIGIIFYLLVKMSMYRSKKKFNSDVEVISIRSILSDDKNKNKDSKEGENK